MAKHVSSCKMFNGAADKAAAQLKAAGVTHAVSLGRRAPMHRMHVDCIKDIIAAGLVPVVVIGSVNGADSVLFDPVRNPLTAAQQKLQIALALGDDAHRMVVRVLPDHTDDAAWMKNLRALSDAVAPAGKTAMHFRAKAADKAQLQTRQKPLAAYMEAFADAGYAVWESFNRDPADDAICASEIRTWDFARLNGAQRDTLAAADYVVHLASAARRDNPHRALLEATGIATGMMDLTLDRLRREAGIDTKTVLIRTAETGDITTARMAAAITGLLAERRAGMHVANAPSTRVPARHAG